MTLVKSVLSKMARNNFSWLLMKPFITLSAFLLTERNKKTDTIALLDEKNHYDDLLREVFKTQTVLHGPFKGLRYPGLNAAGSSVYPKLLGSYEKELHVVLEEICGRPYRNIINIGCGEGYYAVGLALRIPAAQVIAFDTDAGATTLCMEMAELNNVAGRISTQTACTAAFLKTFKFDGHGLIVCDCEGYEKTLFIPDNIHNLRQCDLLIETHDFIELGISSCLTDLFSPSHNIVSIKSTDDIEKVKTYHFAELDHLTLEERKKVLREGRPAIMEWLWVTSKHKQHGTS